MVSKLKVISFKAPLDLIQVCTGMAIGMGKTRSEFIREAIGELIAEEPPASSIPDGGDTYTVKLDTEALELLDRYAKRYRLSRSEAIRIAMIIYIQRYTHSNVRAKVVSGGRIF